CLDGGALGGVVRAGKPVFNVEYKLAASAFCPKANARNFNSLKKRLSLDAWGVPCRGTSRAQDSPRLGVERSFAERASRSSVIGHGAARSGSSQATDG